MVEGDAGHGADAHGGSKPPASAWPLITMLSGLVLGIVLLWWWQDEDSDLTGPLLAASIVVGVLALGAWLIEAISQGRRASRYGDAGDARKTQVITFGIAEGKFDDAQHGVLAALHDAHENLRRESGFEDLRVIASRAESGTSQAIVETTWSSADDLSAYESTRSTILDLVNSHGDEIVAGSVQTFDMDVVRDTKDVFVRMGFGAAFTIVGAILVAGALTGAIIGATTDDVVAAPNGDGGNGGNGGPVASTSVEVIATDNAFDHAEIVAVANEPFTVNLINDGVVLHNIAFVDAQGGELLSPDSVTPDFVAGGESAEFVFTAPDPGSYYFYCELHPDDMNGTFTVVEGGGAPAGGGDDGPATTASVDATDNKFDVSEIVAAAEQPFSVNFTNSGAVLHNLHFLTEEGGETLVDGAVTEDFIAAGESATLEFTTPAAGTYYFQCDLHPTEMNGTFTVQ